MDILQHTAASDRYTTALLKRVAVFLYSPLAAQTEATRSETPPFPSRAKSTNPNKSKAVWQEFSLSFLPVITYTHTHAHTHTQGDPWYAGTKGYACLNITHKHIELHNTRTNCIHKQTHPIQVQQLLTSGSTAVTRKLRHKHRSICMCS